MRAHLPLSEPSCTAVVAAAAVLDAPQAFAGVAGARSRIQAPLPLPRDVLHPLDANGKPTCVENWLVSVCPDHADLKVQARPETCARQACESSYLGNSVERARDAWNGTSDEVENRIGLRHFGKVPFGVFVFTVPEELRPLCVGNRLRRFRKAAGEMAAEVLKALAGSEHAEIYARSWFHPVGEASAKEDAELAPNQGEDFKPHENVVAPLVAFHPGKQKAIPLNRRIPPSWLGKDGWVGETWRWRLVELFGQWWTGDVPPAVNWFYEYRAKPEQKQHAAKYFGRVFPAWARHPDVPLRPRAIGLAHWKKRPHLRAMLDQVHAEALPEWGACLSCVDRGVLPPPKVCGHGKTPEEAKLELCRQLARRTVLEAGPAPAGPYAQHRRIMNPAAPETGADPPTGPPPGPSWTTISDLRTLLWGPTASA